MSSRWTGFFVWALVAACSAFWGIRIFAATRALPPGAQAPQVAVVVAGPMERLFGTVAVSVAAVDEPAPASARFQLVGVIAPRLGSNDTGGLAIVSVDSLPAKAWQVGAKVDGDIALLAVGRRTADFGPLGGPSSFTLELPMPAHATTGTLPGAAGPALLQPAGLSTPPAPSQESGQRLPQPGGFLRGGVMSLPNNGALPPARVAPMPSMQQADGAVPQAE